MLTTAYIVTKRINTRAELLALKRELGVRDDWHEPDEQGVDAATYGDGFDNAGFWGADGGGYGGHQERYVTIIKDGEPIADVNLATLFAWATGYESDISASISSEMKTQVRTVSYEMDREARSISERAKDLRRLVDKD